MLLPSFFIVDIDQFDALPDVELPENAFLSYRISAANGLHIDHFIQKIFLPQRKNPFCILIDLHDDAILKDEFEKTIPALISLSFHYKYVKLNQDSPLIIFDSPVEDTGKYAAIIRHACKEQGYEDIETTTIDSKSKNGKLTKDKNIYFHLQQNIGELPVEYNKLVRTITSTSHVAYFFLSYPNMLPAVLDSISQVELQVKEENPQVYHLLVENLVLTKKEQESLNKAAIAEEQLESLKNYHAHYNDSDTRYKRQITELLYFYKHEYEILPLWYKRFGHIIKVLKGQRTFKSLFRDDVKKYKL